MSYGDDDIDGTAIAFIIFGVIVALCGGGYLIHACTIADKATLGAAEQAVDTKNFEQSPAYREGLRRDFDELMLAYAHAKSDDERTVILSTLRHRVEGAPPDAVPQDVKDFLKQHST